MPIDVRRERSNQLFVGIRLYSNCLDLFFVLGTNHHSVGGPCVFAACQSAQILYVVSFHSKLKEAGPGLGRKLFLFNPDNPCKHYPVSWPALIDQVAHNSNLYIVWKLT